MPANIRSRVSGLNVPRLLEVGRNGNVENSIDKVIASTNHLACNNHKELPTPHCPQPEKIVAQGQCLHQSVPPTETIFSETLRSKNPHACLLSLSKQVPIEATCKGASNRALVSAPGLMLLHVWPRASLTTLLGACCHHQHGASGGARMKSSMQGKPCLIMDQGCRPPPHHVTCHGAGTPLLSRMTAWSSLCNSPRASRTCGLYQPCGVYRPHPPPAH